MSDDSVAERMLRAELPEYREVGLLSQSESKERIDRAKEGVKDVLSFGVADSRVMRPPAHVVEAVKTAMEARQNVYTPHEGDLETRQAVSGYLAKVGIPADPRTQVVITPGTQMGIFAVFMSLVNPGDEVLLTDPDYSCVEPIARLVDAKVTPVALKREAGGYRLNLEELKEKASTRPKLFCFSNPNNPAGVAYAKEDLKAIADVERDYGVNVVADELYGRLVYGGLQHTSLATMDGAAEKTITLMGVTKTESMQGFRVGFVHARKEVAKRLSEVMRFAVQRTSYYSQVAMKALLEEPEGFAEERVKVHQAKRDIIVQELGKSDKIVCPVPQGTSYVFPDISATGLGSQAFVEGLVRKGRVSVSAGFVFGRNGEGHFRLCFASGDDDLREGARRIRAFAEEAKASA